MRPATIKKASKTNNKIKQQLLIISTLKYQQVKIASDKIEAKQNNLYITRKHGTTL